MNEIMRFQLEGEYPSVCIERNSIVRTKMMRRVWDLISDRPVTILDVGCGRCEMWPEFLAAAPQATFYGIDPRRSAVERARGLLPRFRDNLIVGRGEEIPQIFGRSFDIIVSRAVLEHVVRRSAFLNALVDVLAPVGTLIFTYGSQHFKGGLREDLRNLASQIMARLNYDRHYARAVDEEECRAILKRRGMTIVERQYLSLIQVKQAHKGVREDARRPLLLAWLELEESLNRCTMDPESLRQLTDETYFEIRHGLGRSQDEC